MDYKFPVKAAATVGVVMFLGMLGIKSCETAATSDVSALQECHAACNPYAFSSGRMIRFSIDEHGHPSCECAP